MVHDFGCVVLSTLPRVRVFVFLLSGLFCCLGFSGVIFFSVWAGAPFFCCLGGGPGPAQTAKKKQQKKHAPAPSDRFFCFAVWAGGCVHFFVVWAGGVFFFVVWAGGVFLCLLFGRGRVLFFAVWAGSCSFFCCLGWERVFFLLFGRGTGVHSLTRLPGSSLSDPTTKETEQQKKNTGSPSPGLTGKVNRCDEKQTAQVYINSYKMSCSVYTHVLPMKDLGCPNL